MLLLKERVTLKDAQGVNFVPFPPTFTTHTHQFASRLSTGRGRLFFGQMALLQSAPVILQPTQTGPVSGNQYGAPPEEEEEAEEEEDFCQSFHSEYDT